MIKRRFVYRLKAWDKFFLSIIAFLALLHLVVGDIDNLSFVYQSFKPDNQPKIEFTEINKATKKYKIGIVFPAGYAGGEEALSNCLAAKNLGWQCYIFGYSLKTEHDAILQYYASIVFKLINYFNQPDFIIYLQPSLMLKGDQSTKYGVMDVTQSDVLKFRESGKVNNPNDLKWMTYYDGYIVYGNITDWFFRLKKEVAKHYKLSDEFISGAYPSVYWTNYQPSKKHKLVYYGNNWDKRRSSNHYKEIFKLLGQRNYFEVYGHPTVWGNFHNSYKGTIPFDNESFIRKLETLGIALVLHSEFHLKYGIPSKRVFEAAAANNVIISDPISFVVKEFGECVYYINPDDAPKQVVEDIDRIVNLVRSDENLANEKAKCAHDVFVKKFAVENQLTRIGQMHEKVHKSKELKLKR